MGHELTCKHKTKGKRKRYYYYVSGGEQHPLNNALTDQQQHGAFKEQKVLRIQ